MESPAAIAEFLFRIYDREYFLYLLKRLRTVKKESAQEQINQISDGYGEALNLKHYVVITQNYNIDIATEWEPTIEISKM